LSLLSLSDTDLRGDAIEAVILQERLCLGCLQEVDEISCGRDILGGPDGGYSIVDRLVRAHWRLIKNADLLIRDGVCPVDDADVGFALGD
jgi:hypothetical protein